MSTLKVGDKLVYFSGDYGRFELLEDPHWLVKLIVGGMTFFMGSPERTSGGTWNCPGLSNAQADAILRMVGAVCRLSVSLSPDDEESSGLTGLFDGKVKNGLRRSDLYRRSALLRYTPEGLNSHFDLSRIDGSSWAHALGIILTFGFWSPEDECREVIASWDCPGLNAKQAVAVCNMAADLLWLSAARIFDNDEPNDIVFEFARR